MQLKFTSALSAIFLASFSSLAAGGQRAPLLSGARDSNVRSPRATAEKQSGPDATEPDGTTKLHRATYQDDFDAVVKLIRIGADVNARNDYGVTPLSLACSNGNAQIIETLLKAGADPNATVRSGETPLMLAARTGNVEAVRLLLTYRAAVNANETWNGQTALMWAAEAGHAQVVQVLIDANAQVEARSKSGLTPLLFAVRRGDVETVRVLLAAGADVNAARPDGATPLLVAVINGHEDLVDLLLDKGADPNTEGGSTAFTHPGVRAKAKPLDLSPVTEQDLTATGNVSKADHTNIYGTPLHAAVYAANPEASDVYLAIRFDKIRVITALLAHGANINARLSTEEPRGPGQRYRVTLTGATPFLLAAKASDVELMRLLLAHGADPNIETFDHQTALMAAAGIAWAANQDQATDRRVLEAVEMLVNELHADVNHVSDRKETPMHAAAYRGANYLVEFLAKKGARLDAKDRNGRTPAMVADGVAYGNAFAAHPDTAALLRSLEAASRAHQ